MVKLVNGKLWVAKILYECEGMCREHLNMFSSTHAIMQFSHLIVVEDYIFTTIWVIFGLLKGFLGGRGTPIYSGSYASEITPKHSSLADHFCQSGFIFVQYMIIGKAFRTKNTHAIVISRSCSPIQFLDFVFKYFGHFG